MLESTSSWREPRSVTHALRLPRDAGGMLEEEALILDVPDGSPTPGILPGSPGV